MAEFLADVRYSLRLFARNPGFVAIAILTLALGIGANTAIFTIFDSVVLRPLPFRDPGRLVAIREAVPRFASLSPTIPVAAAHFLEWKKQARSFDRIALFGERLVDVTSPGEPERVTIARASASLFPMLGVEPRIGRTFTEDEDRPGHDQVVVLSDGLWTSRFHRDPAVIGSKVVLDGSPYEVIGVMPPGFRVPRTSQLTALGIADDYAQLWKPFALRDAEIEPIGNFNFGCIARLKPSVSIRQARGELDVIMDALVQTLPEKVQVLAQVVPLQEQVAGRVRASLVLLLAAVGAVLLIACGNIANLLLARAAGRSREMAIRTALGARVSRLVRQTLTESLLLAAPGGLLGAALARVILRVVLLQAPVDLPRIGSVQMDWRVAGFALLITCVSGVFFGVLPAWHMAHADPQATLQSTGRSLTAGRRSGAVRRSLIAAEVALSAVCLSVAGLLLHSFVQVLRVDKGFQADRAVTVKIGLSARYPKLEDQGRFIKALLDRIASQPGVVSAGVTNVLPLGGEGNNNLVMPEGASWPLLERPLADMRSASPDFFSAMGIPLRSGRVFGESDRDRRVALISASLARRLWPRENALGKRLLDGDGRNPPIEVIGVTGDVHGAALQKPANPTAYLPYWQRGSRDFGVVVRTAADPLTVVSAVRAQVRALDPQLPVPPFQTVSQLVDASVSQRRFQLDLVLLFAAAALVLAAIGVYGVMSQSVAQRTQEIGIRMALGATGSSVTRLVLLQGLFPVGVGLLAGLASSLAAGRLLGGWLFGVAAADPLTFVAVALVLLSAAAASCYLPARKATRVDPLLALRYE